MSEIQGQEMLHINEDQVKELLNIADAINILKGCMSAVSSRSINIPNRFAFEVGNENKLGIMPGAILSSCKTSEPCFGAKLVSLFPSNTARGKSSHQGVMIMFDSTTGDMLATIECGALTAIRTAAASALATHYLTEEIASKLTIIGTGEQAKWHLDAMIAIRPIKDVVICGRSPENIKNFVDRANRKYPSLNILGSTDVQASVSKADIICTVTSSRNPVLEADWITPGSHLNVVGSSFPDAKEIPSELIQHAHLYVDYTEATLKQAGEVIEAIEAGLINKEHIKAEIGELISGAKTACISDRKSEITIYRSLGVAAQDLSCANFLYKKVTANEMSMTFQ